jgi:hypothetical protein
MTCGTPLRLDDRPRVSTSTASTVRATTTIVDVGGATTATTIVTAAGHRTKEVLGPLVRASATQSFLCVCVLRLTCQGTMRTPTPACDLRTTDLRAMPGERQKISSSSRICRSTSATPHRHGSSTCLGTRSTTGPTYIGSSSGTSKAPTCTPTSSGSCATASSSRGRASASTYDASPSAAPSSPVRPTTTPSRHSKTARRAHPSSTGLCAACPARLVSSLKL